MAKGQKMAKSKKWIRAKKAEASRAKNLDQSWMILTSKARQAFTKLRQEFIEAPILNHFDLERHIQIKTDVSGYAIGGILNQLTSDDLGQYVMTWARDLLCDAVYSLHPSHQCDLILMKSTNSAHLFKRYYSQDYRARAYEDF